MFRNEIPYLLIRLAFGAVLLSHGLLLKVFTLGIENTLSYFNDAYNIPATLTYLIIFGETFGGLAILVGLYTRLAALLSLPILIGAFCIHLGNGWLFSNPGGGWEFPALLIIMAIILSIRGNGILAIRQLPIIDAFIPDILK